MKILVFMTLYILPSSLHAQSFVLPPGYSISDIKIVRPGQSVVSPQTYQTASECNKCIIDAAISYRSCAAVAKQCLTLCIEEDDSRDYEIIEKLEDRDYCH